LWTKGKYIDDCDGTCVILFVTYSMRSVHKFSTATVEMSVPFLGMPLIGAIKTGLFHSGLQEKRMFSNFGVGVGMYSVQSALVRCKEIRLQLEKISIAPGIYFTMCMSMCNWYMYTHACTHKSKAKFLAAASWALLRH